MALLMLDKIQVISLSSNVYFCNKNIAVYYLRPALPPSAETAPFPYLEHKLWRCFQEPFHGLEEEGGPDVALVVKAEKLGHQFVLGMGSNPSAMPFIRLVAVMNNSVMKVN